MATVKLQELCKGAHLYTIKHPLKTDNGNDRSPPWPCNSKKHPDGKLKPNKGLIPRQRNSSREAVYNEIRMVGHD